MGNNSVTPCSRARKIVCQIFRFMVSSLLCNRGRASRRVIPLPSLVDAPASSPGKGEQQRRGYQVDGRATAPRLTRLIPSLSAGNWQVGRVSPFSLTSCASDYLLADFGRVTRAATTQMMARMKKATACVGCEASGGVVVSG